MFARDSKGNINKHDVTQYVIENLETIFNDYTLVLSKDKHLNITEGNVRRECIHNSINVRANSEV